MTVPFLAIMMVHPQRIVDDGQSMLAHPAGAPGMIAGAAIMPCVIQQLVVGPHILAGQTVRQHIAFTRSRLERSERVNRAATRYEAY
jgi:hypothetical protein